MTRSSLTRSMEPSAAEELIRDYDQVLKDYDALPRYATRDDLAELHDYDFYTLHDREEQRSNADNGAQHFEGPFAVNEKDGEFFLVDGCRRRQAIMKKHGENEWQAVKVKCVVFKNLKLKEKAVVRFQPFVYLMKKEFSKPFDHGIMAQWTVGMWPQLPQTPERVKKYAKEISPFFTMKLLTNLKKNSSSATYVQCRCRNIRRTIVKIWTSSKEKPN
ncbi:hypothetical protein QR680_007280 [Steinernema hermaphroditum]|uniref:ParB/Sulfiredoxin domain-containing protein n=1 Tax=Steinernema hermaphroditum TaxID=289476 RepID=A0AA39HY93_9BILA|nr:hypothetical protein QR680_007280 [Steinernema hermaphroditum]